MFKKIILSVSSFILVVIVGSFFLYYNNTDKDVSKPKETINTEELQNNLESETKKPKDYEKYANLDIEEKYNKSNLDLDKIPSDDYVKGLVKSLISLNKDSDVNTFKETYKVNNKVENILPKEGKTNSTILFKSNYPEGIDSVNVSINYDSLKGNKVSYLVTLSGNNISVSYILSFEDKILIDIKDLK